MTSPRHQDRPVSPTDSSRIINNLPQLCQLIESQIGVLIPKLIDRYPAFLPIVASFTSPATGGNDIAYQKTKHFLQHVANDEDLIPAFIDCLTEIGHSQERDEKTLHEAATIIRPDLDIATTRSIHSSSLSSSPSSMGDSIPRTLTVKPARVLKSGGNDYYRMESVPRGPCGIINNVNFPDNETRHGSDLDAERLKSVFSQLNFTVESRRDLSAVAMLDFTNEIKKQLDDTTDALVMIVMTHGYDDEMIFGTDNMFVKIRDLITPFLSPDCPELIGKPKIFWFISCRGWTYDTPDLFLNEKPQEVDNEDEIEEATHNGYSKRKVSKSRRECCVIDAGEFKAPNAEQNIPNPTGEGSSSSTSRRPSRPSLTPEPQIKRRPSDTRVYDDVLIAYSTVYGFVSHRDPEGKGTWYGLELVKVLTKHARDKDIIEILQEVDKGIKTRESPSGCKQTSSFENNGFHKKLYFNPGF